MKKLVPITFLGLLTAGMLLLIFLPKSDISEDENRALAKLPPFKIDALADGSFTSELGEYLNDHFPWRKTFVGAGNKISSLLTYSGGSVDVTAGKINGSMGEGETLLDAPKSDKPAAAKIDLPEDIDYNNKRGVIIAGTRAMELFKYDYSMILGYAEKLNTIADAVPDVNVYSLVVPTSVEFYSPLKYHSNTRSQKNAIDDLYTLTSYRVKRVDAYTYLAAKADEYLYFRTDHHWTARGAYEGYYAFCEAAGLEAAELDEENKTIIDGFLGTLYSATQKEVLADNPDYVEVFTPPEAESCTAYTAADMATPYGCALLVDPGGSTNKYLTFLGGDNPLVHIVTTNKNGRRLLVLKDSFSNAMSLFLTNNYEEIYLIDPRSTQTDIAEFCSAHAINDLLIENYAFGMSNPEAQSGLAGMVPAGE